MAKIPQLVLFSCYLLQYAEAQDYTIRNYNRSSGLYYERIGKANIYVKDFNIITYYDLEKYNTNYEDLKNYTNKVATICNRLGSADCKDFVKLHKSILMNLEHKHELIGDTIGVAQTQTPTRQKRSWTELALAGINGIFGLIDTSIKENTVADEVEKYRDEVNSLQKMVAQQMFLYENLQRDMNNRFKEVSSKIDIILGDLDIINTNINSLRQQIEENLLIQYTNTLLQLVSMEQSDLLDCLILARQGVLHPMIVSVEMLRKRILEVKNIANYDSHMGNLLGIAAKNANAIFNMIKPVIYRKNKIIIFDFNVPLIAEATYDIYKLTSSPILINQDVYAYIYPEGPYLFIDRNNARHFFLERQEFNECKIAGDKLYLCKRVKPLRAKALTCEHRLITNPEVMPNNCDVRLMHINQPLFLELEQDGSWLFVAPKSENLHMYCDQHLRRMLISGTGTLNVSTHCRNIETDTLILRDYSTNHLNLPYSFDNYTPKASLEEFVRGTNTKHLFSYMNNMAIPRSDTSKMKEVGVSLSFLQIANQAHIGETLQSNPRLYQKQTRGSAVSLNQISYNINFLSSLLICVAINV